MGALVRHRRLVARQSQEVDGVASLVGITAALIGVWIFHSQEQPQTQDSSQHTMLHVVVKDGDDLGSIGAKYGQSRIEMIGFNLDLIRQNTSRCGSNMSGVCARTRFGEETLAFDALKAGDTVRLPVSVDKWLAAEQR